MVVVNTMGNGGRRRTIIQGIEGSHDLHKSCITCVAISNKVLPRGGFELDETTLEVQ